MEWKIFKAESLEWKIFKSLNVKWRWVVFNKKTKNLFNYDPEASFLIADHIINSNISQNVEYLSYL